MLSMKIWITNFEKSTNLRSFAEKNLRKKHFLVFFFGIHRQANKKKFLFRATKFVRFFYQNWANFPFFSHRLSSWENKNKKKVCSILRRQKQCYKKTKKEKTKYRGIWISYFSFDLNCWAFFLFSFSFKKFVFNFFEEQIWETR